MADRRALWGKSFVRVPDLRCPTCNSGILQVKDKPVVHQTAGSRADLDDCTSFEPILFVQRFTMMLVCTNARCQEGVAVCGDTFEDLYQEQDGCIDSVTTFEPVIMYPGPPLSDIPTGTPLEVGKALQASFVLFWADLGSAANKLRVAAERILDDKKIKRTTINARRKRVQLSLSDRIAIYASTGGAQHKDMLTALRWIGNEGSHTGNIDRDDLLTGFELMQLGLEDLYGGDYRKQLAKKLKSIVARKGKPKRPRRHVRKVVSP